MEHPGPIELSVVVVNWNGCALLQRCLTGVYRTIQRTCFELVVVDNDSQDNSVAMVKTHFPNVRVLQNSANVGFARANNQAFAICQGRQLLLLNNDAFPLGDCIDQMHEYLQQHPAVGIVGANLRFPDGRWQLSHWPLPTLGSELLSMLALDRYGWRGAAPSPAFETGAVSGACLMVRSHLFKELGLLDERFFFFGEEVDLCARARAAGWKVVHLGGACVIHVGGGNAGPTAERMLLLYAAKVLYFRKHFGTCHAGVLAWALRVASLGKLLLFAFGYILSWGKVRRVKLWWKVVLNFNALGQRNMTP